MLLPQGQSLHWFSMMDLLCTWETKQIRKSLSTPWNFAGSTQGAISRKLLQACCECKDILTRSSFLGLHVCVKENDADKKSVTSLHASIYHFLSYT